MARNAVKAGIGWVLVNAEVAYVDELRAAHPGLPIAMVGTDQREVGRIQGRQGRALVPGGDHVLCVQGPADASATARRFEGLKEALGAGFEVRSVNGDWTEAGGEKAVVVMAAPQDRGGVQAGPGRVPERLDGDRRTQGPARAPQRWGTLPLLGCDGLPEGGQKQVAEGLLAGTVVTPPNTGFAFELVARWLETKQAPPRELLLLPRSHPPEDRIRPRGSR